MRIDHLLACAVAVIVCTLPPQLVAAPEPTGKQLLDNPLEPLSPKQPRTEDDEDHLAALAHFSAGRMLEQRQQLPEALREYERAIRYDPSGTAVLRELVPLAFSLDRPDEGLRYVVKYIDQSELDTELLQRAAEYLGESGQWDDALKLYKQAAAQLAKEKPSPQQIDVELQIGRLSFLNEQYADSAAALRQVMEALEHPDTFGISPVAHKTLLGEGGATYELIGQVLIEAKQPADAREAFERFNKIQPDAAKLALNLAQVELAEDKPEKALEQLNTYFEAERKKLAAQGEKKDEKQTEEDERDQTIAYETLAKAMKQLKQEDQLIPKLEAMLAEQPNAALKLYLAEKYEAADKPEKAEPLLESVHQDAPSEKTYEALAECYRRSDQPEKLVELAAEMIEKTGSLTALGDQVKPIIEDEKLMTALVDTAIKEHGDAKTADASALRAVGLIAAEARRWQDAEKLFNLTLKADPKLAGELYQVWGVGLLLDEKNAEAAKVLQRGIDEKVLPDDKPDLFYYLAGALGSEDKTEEALAAAKVAVEKQPKNPRFADRVAWVLYHAKRYDEAAKAYQEVLDKFDSDYTTEGARDILRGARGALSNLSALRKDNKQAVEWLEQVLDEFPDDAGANNDLGFLWADQNQHLHRALKMIQYAVAEEPDNYAYQDSLGWVLFRLGRNAEALEQLKKAASEKDVDGEVLDHLAQVYAAMGQTDAAQTTWKEAVEAFKKAGEEEKMKAVEEKLEKAK